MLREAIELVRDPARLHATASQEGRCAFDERYETLKPIYLQHHAARLRGS